MGYIVFVHGTGVREESYLGSLKQIQTKLEQLKKKHPELGSWNVAECLWGDELGAKLNLNGKSLPDYQGTATRQQPGEIMQWWQLYQDPELELRVWEASEPAPDFGPPTVAPKWKAYDAKLKAYRPSSEVQEVLTTFSLTDDWQLAWEEVVHPDRVYQQAVQTVTSEQDFQALTRLVLRAVMAQATIQSQKAGRAAPPAVSRDEVIRKMAEEIAVPIMGLRTWLAAQANKTAGAWHKTTEAVKASVGLALAYSGMVSRDTITDKTFRFGGDILLYQARGQKIRAYITSQLAGLDEPVVLFAHSLGGIACVDLLVETSQPQVAGLITVGSQAPLLYEMNCLTSLEAGLRLPDHFPPWLNLYDVCDLLSYPAAGVFPERVQDHQLNSGLPYMQAHSAYWGEPEVWNRIAHFLTTLPID
ncbi:MAG: hypothetical protein K1Y36_21920 [Blastocatellia bacterium]|nr:hypothetical protein [Blastocatellia bacterium]